jgi:hypothetical protein
MSIPLGELTEKQAQAIWHARDVQNECLRQGPAGASGAS